MTLMLDHPVAVTRFRAFGPRQIDDIAGRYGLRPDLREEIALLAHVFPFRVNEYVLDHLIDWTRPEEDPMFRLVFPQRGMLSAEDEQALAAVVHSGSAAREVAAVVARIRAGLNPHPSGQREYNVPMHRGERLPGLQHKYRETVLYFPTQGQSCHSYCTYCFRWAQFVGDPALRFATPGPDRLVDYLRDHPEVSDVLVTGGDPMIMSTERLRGHLEPLLDVPTVQTVRIGTKSLAYWPQRYVSDADSDELLRLFGRIIAAGKQVAVMAHFTHPCELRTPLVATALRRIRSTGAVIYCQAPMVSHVNDQADVWAELWRAELAAGAVPYYMFVERDTGPYDYFKVPLARAVEIFHAAYRTLPGLARTVRGPVMSTTSGKVVVDGVESHPDGRCFQLRMLQARNPALVGRPFRAQYHTGAAWLSELELAADVPDDIRTAVRS
ncbi:lysine 2,3-aminomutase [Micromonospora sp. WMMD1082]|uniref:KamA family radical SAM protein n=1 Tax=Micromonospora sp. WMMD1082 TaxID=3016104 RepID=UPI002417BFDA|nr:lysine 2,3-aminomutase [Micromonospora sp. WMMD1082]MDG4795554.1 lysine 2,3-aminomutase [Micromonospora sp. WMMD1082]